MAEFIDRLERQGLFHAVEALTKDVDSKAMVEIPIEILARGPKAQKAFNEALSEGETEVNHGTTIFLGLERVGKTSTIGSFLKHPFNANEDITDAIANTRTVIPQESSDELYWKETDQSGATGIYEEKMVDAIVKELSEKERGNKVPVAIANNTKISPDIVDKAEMSTDNIEGQSSSGGSRSVGTEPERKKRRKNTQTQPIDTVPEKIASKVQERMNQIKFKGEATTEWQKSGKDFIMNIWDFGGQPIYHVIQRIFLVSFAIVCVVFNLEDDLDAPAKVRDPTTGKMYEHRMTNLEFILYWIRSVYTNSRPDSKLDDSQLSPSVLVIGTHLGSLKGNEQEQKNKAEEIFCKIRQALAGKPYEAMVFSTFFAIENSLPFSKSNASSIMSQIFKFAKKMVRILPLKWLHVQHEIQKKKQKNIYLPTNKVIDLISQCGVKVEAQRVLLLEYLHDVGEILYFPDDEDLKRNIVLDLMKIVDMFKTVITVIDPDLQGPVLRDAWRRLDSGILEERLLRHLWKKFNFSKETFNFFISLMQKFGLVCEKKLTTGDERVFYVLSRLKPKRVDSSPTGYGRCAVSIFHDFSNYLPDDVFQRGATKFIDKFQVEDNEAKLSYEHVELSIDELHHVVLNVATIKHRRMLQTTIIRLKIIKPDQLPEEDEPSPTVCKKVLSFLEENLKVFCQSGARGVELTKYIQCECSPNMKDAHMHIVHKFNKNVLPCGSDRMEVMRYRRLFEGYEPQLQEKESI
ncbi:uncharacterized protein LOC117124908 [Anneissia japonica]|uniref:uncharacterized protein LOC117124908 n=1 Tax=Anneissia japonica TaxID=1529436 RepID=UPI001425B60A|nr:uncharacterized protein LOC117124908 [Anneissia japonica]